MADAIEVIVTVHKLFAETEHAGETYELHGYLVVVTDETGRWDENCSTREEADAFVRGLRAGANIAGKIFLPPVEIPR
jgi:hypothetical protein